MPADTRAAVEAAAHVICDNQRRLEGRSPCAKCGPASVQVSLYEDCLLCFRIGNATAKAAIAAYFRTLGRETEAQEVEHNAE